MTTVWLVQDIARDEGCRLKCYRDTKNIRTIGYGHTGPEVCDGLLWTQVQATTQLSRDVTRACRLLDQHLPWWRKLDDARQDVLASMCFNMGIGDASHGLSSFTHTLALIQAGDYAEAADHMLQSKWATEVKGRAVRLAEQMKTGERAP